MRCAVIGAGSWGTAVARHLGRQGNDVMLWSHGEVAAQGINETHRNPRYLPDCELPESVVASTDLSACLEGAQSVVLVVPSKALRETAARCAGLVAQDTPLIVLTKGIERGTSKLMTQVVAEEMGNPARVACLSGPNHAEEVARDMPSAAVIAADDPQVARGFQGLFHSDLFRTYVSSDVVGVETCAAAKNVVAIACGIARGMGTGDNTAAMLMTRGLAEMTRLVYATGGDPLACMGLAGMGDLVATCTSRHSRNFTFGESFAKGETLEEYCARTHMVVEGYYACASVRDLALAGDVDAPLVEGVYQLMYEGLPLEVVVDALYARTPKVEFYGLDLEARQQVGRDADQTA